MVSGWVYVLVNSSMPGLVKVGKTTRDPTERVGELSGVTGVATPFILAFKHYFDDCDTVEFQVHHSLEARGVRVSSGREFFRVEASDVVALLVEIGKVSGKPPSSKVASDDADILMDDFDDEFSLDDDEVEPPWQQILDDAYNARYGLEGEIEDHVHALALYKDAIRLGAIVAYEDAGSIYEDGKGVPENLAKALDYYRTGTKKGNYFCWANMALMFTRIGKYDNASKAWEKFFAARQDNVDPVLEGGFGVKFGNTLFWFSKYCMENNLYRELTRHAKQHFNETDSYCGESIARYNSRLSKEQDESEREHINRMIKSMNEVRQWLNDL